jgi:hypothetical protein
MRVNGTRAERAYLAKILEGEVTYVYEFQFNPSEDEKTREVAWAWAVVGPLLPEAIFIRLSREAFSLQLFLDATENYDPDKQGVGADIAALDSFTMPYPEIYCADMGQVASPPLTLFGIGEDAYYVVVNSVNVRVVRRNSEMHPTRAYVDLKLTSTYVDTSQMLNSLNKNSELARKVLVARRA